MIGVTLSKCEMCIGNVRQGYYDATGRILFVLCLKIVIQKKEGAFVLEEDFRQGKISGRSVSEILYSKTRACLKSEADKMFFFYVRSIGRGLDDTAFHIRIIETSPFDNIIHP